MSIGFLLRHLLSIIYGSRWEPHVVHHLPTHNQTSHHLVILLLCQNERIL
ncbi:hypothetical protein Pint_03764 [Pistacia integerrima]|uniref:Uncharacterized protein n=1 Tax=Pistacia integerrima TaxID=434235 RepID=A0ACC0Z4U7_9ROSI|nr:hypothetical protein Pint_03764 [Pistacia integerrima]